MTLSPIIPTRNRPASLDRLLQVLVQDMSGSGDPTYTELIVADDSRDAAWRTELNRLPGRYAHNNIYIHYRPARGAPSVNDFLVDQHIRDAVRGQSDFRTLRHNTSWCDDSVPMKVLLDVPLHRRSGRGDGR